MKLRRAFLAALLAAALPVAALAQGAGSTMQFPTSPWGGFAPDAVQCGWLKGANFNITTDQAIPLSVPSVGWMVERIVISAPSTSMTSAQGGFYTGASKTGVAVVASTQAYTSLTTNAANTTGNAMLATISTAGNTTELSSTPVLYFSLTSAQGAPATANIRVFCDPLYSVN